MWFVPRAQLQLLTPEADASTYSFNKHAIHHRFCPVCGMHPYGEGRDRKGNEMAAINIRCLEDIDLERIEVTPSTAGPCESAQHRAVRGAHRRGSRGRVRGPFRS
jgi:hypothetical protein